MEYREYSNTGGTQDSRERERTEYSVVRGVQRVQEHWGNTEDRARARLQHVLHIRVQSS